MRSNKRKIKNRKRIIKELETIRRRFIIAVLLIIVLILISVIGKTIATEEIIEPISENVSMVKSSDDKWVPVPKGYSASKIPGETSVNGGFVIYEGENINWSFLENTSEASTLELNSEDKNLVEKDNTNVNGETETQERILTSAIKHTYMSNELLEENEELKNDENIIEQTENENNLINDEYNKEIDLRDEDIINNDDNNLENNDLLENPKENENDIISKENEKETQDENQILDTEENDLSSINSNENEQPVITEEEEISEPQSQLEKDIFNLQCSTNQYVWIPVENVLDLYGVDETGKLWGKLYNFNKNSKFALNWTETDGIISITSLTSYREPDIVIDYDYESVGLKDELDGITQYEFLQKELEQFFYTTIESIKKYGGFYIGRYETGGLSKGESAVVRKMDINLQEQNWYQLYKKSKTLGAGKPSVTTSMIWGSLWDETLDWFVKSEAILNSTGKQIEYSNITDSINWGNYHNATFNYYSNSDMDIAEKPASNNIRIPSGSSEYTKVNNVYDMAGNIAENTLEAFSTKDRVYRGGNYANTNASTHSSNRRYNNNSPTSSKARLSCYAFD